MEHAEHRSGVFVIGPAELWKSKDTVDPSCCVKDREKVKCQAGGEVKSRRFTTRPGEPDLCESGMEGCGEGRVRNDVTSIAIVKHKPQLTHSEKSMQTCACGQSNLYVPAQRSRYSFFSAAAISR